MAATNDPRTWGANIARATRTLGVTIAKAEKAAVANIAGLLVDNSPVRSGRFRANWQHGVNIAPAGEITALDPTGSDTKARLAQAIAQSDPGVHYLVNNLPYAAKLEFGWSPQRPQGIVLATVMQVKGLVAEDIARAIEQQRAG